MKELTGSFICSHSVSKIKTYSIDDQVGKFIDIGFFCKFIFGFEIRNQIGYTICIVGGFLLRHLLIAILSGNV